MRRNDFELKAVAMRRGLFVCEFTSSHRPGAAPLDGQRAGEGLQQPFALAGCRFP